MVSKGCRIDNSGHDGRRVVSAGFVYPSGKPYGRSESLGLDSRPEDEDIIKDSYAGYLQLE